MAMNYLILYQGTHERSAFYTNWFDPENNYIEGMTVFNLLTHTFTTDGKTWKEIVQDHL